MVEKICLFNLWDFEVDGGWAEGGFQKEWEEVTRRRQCSFQPEWTSDYLG